MRININHAAAADIDPKVAHQCALVACAAFGRLDDQAMYEDAINHVMAGQVSVAMYNGQVVGFQSTIVQDSGHVELNGIAIGPDHHSKGIGQQLSCAAFNEVVSGGDLTVIAFTRNPAVVTLMGKVCTETNISNPDLNQQIPMAVDHEISDGVPYQLGRYVSPLYGAGHDPADTGAYPALSDQGNALVVLGRYAGGQDE